MPKGPVKSFYILSLACLLLDGRRHHVTSGGGTPVALQMSVMVSPSDVMISSLDKLSTICDGTANQSQNHKLIFFVKFSFFNLLYCLLIVDCTVYVCYKQCVIIHT